MYLIKYILPFKVSAIPTLPFLFHNDLFETVIIHKAHNGIKRN